MKRLVAASLLGALLLAGLFPLYALEIRALREGRTVWLHTVRPGFRFALGFTHSVEHCPVWDYLRVDEQYRMVLYKTAFWSSRTGLPYAAFGDEVFAVEGDHFAISNMHRVIPGLQQWVSRQYGNTLLLGDTRRVDLAGLAGDTLLSIAVTRMPLWSYVTKKLDLTFT
jgi:hypothetical protein